MTTLDWHEWTGPRPTDVEPYRALRRVIADFRADTRWGHAFRWHWFFDEPWAPWVVRFLVPSNTLTPSFASMQGDWHLIDVQDDMIGYGTQWQKAYRFFEAASDLGLAMACEEDHGSLLYPRKLVHCAMNAWGYTYGMERLAYGEMQASAVLLSLCEDDPELYNALAGRMRDMATKRGYFAW